jgi:hypothetical protein
VRDLGGAGRVHEEPRLHEGRWAAAVAHGDAPARSPKPALADRPPAAPLSAACAFFCAECRRSCRACTAQTAASYSPQECFDRFKDCASMARAPDGCASRFMTRNCRVTCKLCHFKDEL